MMKDKVELFLLDYLHLNQEDTTYLSILDDKEKEYLSSFNNQEVRKEKLFSLLLKKKYIGDYYIDEKLKPKSKLFKFNISHSNGYMVLAKNKKYEIGVDIELIRDYKKELIDKACSDIEKEYVKDNKTFFEIWTSKESLVKAIGTGIISNMGSVPSLPINGVKQYKSRIWYSKSLTKSNYVISITLENNSAFDVVLKKVSL